MAKNQNNIASIKIPPRLNAFLDDEVKLQLGQNIMDTKALTKKFVVDKTLSSTTIKTSNKLLMNNLFVEKSSNPVYQKLNYCLMPGKIIKAGPIVGVLIAGKNSTSSPRPIARKARIYEEMTLQADKKNIFLYFFYANGVDWGRKVVNGFVYTNQAHRKEQWVKARFNLPDIVYNRISYRAKEDTNAVQKFMQKAKQSSIYIFNSRFLNKWEVHQSLVNSPLTRKFVLEADSYSNEALAKYMNKYHEFFIKPIASSLGKGIIKVITSQTDAIKYFRLGKSTDWQTCHSQSELYSRLAIPEGGKYILQKGINLATIGNQVFDIRAQVQKNGQGDWQFTGAAVRLAAVGKFVTHVPNGGSKRDYHLTVDEIFGHSSPITVNLDKQLKTICQVVPEVLEESLGINLALLSLDIGIDQDGQMWIIEANSKPASFDEDPIRQRHLDLLTDYFLYKSNFNVH